MNWLTALILGLFVSLFVYAASDLPNSMADTAPARRHVAAVYIERSYAETHTPNMVTAVLADYRSYDTFGETVVILAAGLAVTLLLPRGR
ncbi:MAG TPA: hydrogen gas-evolving membrane-bound hydrogenase subunit E [Terriglobales bacterium]|nr:hydrogen gas-evolving membrane-bound hydrogenase subunit E [Terriglobales bacterium]